MGDRVVYNGRVDRFLAMEFTDPTFEKTLKCEVEHIDNGGTKYINIYCDQYHEPMTREEFCEKIMDAFDKFNGGRILE
jgi:glutamate dehydrogenase/leucine dehydrogenase